MSWNEIARVHKVGTKASYFIFKRGKTRNNVDSIDIREHFERADGSLQHTGKGITIPAESFTDFMVACRDVSDLIRDLQ